jgi:hypothetical protein
MNASRTGFSRESVTMSVRHAVILRSSPDDKLESRQYEVEINIAIVP